jgi:hypothetical protein
MIPARPGLTALFRMTAIAGRQIPADEPAHRAEPIVAWSDHGEPMVADPNTGRLVSALVSQNFAGLGADNRLVQIIPGGGWRVEWTRASGTKRSEPIAAWGLLANGDIVPFGLEGNGDVWRIDTERDDSARIYHPDGDQPPPEIAPALEAA